MNRYTALIILFVVSILSVILLTNLKFSLQSSQGSASRSISESLRQEGIELTNKPYIMIWKTADWCGLCAATRSEIEQTAKEFSTSLQIVEIDADINPVLSEMISTTGIPALAIYKSSGELLGEIDLALKQDIKSAVGQLIGYN